MIDVLGMCHEFGFVELETSIGEFLKEILNVVNVCLIFDSSRLYQMKFLYKVCIAFIDAHAKEIIQHESFSNLSGVSQNSIFSLIYFFFVERD